MKFPATLFFSLLASALCALAQDTPATFLKAVEEAFTEQSDAKLEALVYTEGMSDADKELTTRMQKQMLSNPDIDKVELGPLPADFQSVHVGRGKRYEPTALPVGTVNVAFKKTGTGASSFSIPYATVKGRFHLIGTKSTPLNWTGPDDKTVGYMIIGKGQDAVKGKVKWNASGVDLEKALSSPSSSFVGQYVDEVSITSDSDETDVTITIMENGQQIFQSAPLQGKGTLSYKRPSQAAP